jgi:phosphatidylglycerol:prolipoprotein diacylglycerol transferase
MQPFSIVLGFGVLAGLLLTGWRALQKDMIRYVDAGVFTLFGALLGSRTLTVAVNFTYYQTHMGEIYQVWLGGLSGIGALVGGLLAALIIARWWRIPLGELADALLPLAGAIAITAWMGCWVDRCGYGMQSSAWWAIPAHDEWGVLAKRIPVQLVGASLTLVLIWILDRASKHLPIHGMSATIGLLGLSAVLFGLSYLRVDPTPVWNGLRLEAWGAMGLMIFSIITVVVLLVRWKYKK